MTKSQEEFVDQMTRKLMVDWCDASITSADGTFTIPLLQTAYKNYAASKKWLSATDSLQGCKVLSAGWDTAARFLKR